MKTCQYCGVQNPDDNSTCLGCGGNDLRMPGQPEPPRRPLTHRQRLGWACTILGITVVFSSILYDSSVTYRPELGEGNYRVVGARFVAIAGFLTGVATAFVGLYLKSAPTKGSHANFLLTPRLHLTVARAFRSGVQGTPYMLPALHLPPRRRQVRRL